MLLHAVLLQSLCCYMATTCGPCVAASCCAPPHPASDPHRRPYVAGAEIVNMLMHFPDIPWKALNMGQLYAGSVNDRNANYLVSQAVLSRTVDHHAKRLYEAQVTHVTYVTACCNATACCVMASCNVPRCSAIAGSQHVARHRHETATSSLSRGVRICD